MNKRNFLLILLVILFVTHSVAAEEAQVVRDGAALLAPQTVNQLIELSDALEEQTGFRLSVDVRHFLGGAQPDAFAQTLLSQRQDKENTLLLLAVIGEERYALAAGSNVLRALPQDAQQSLLSRWFRTPFLNRRYDDAVLTVMAQAAAQMAIAKGVALSAEPLVTPAPTAAPSTGYKTIQLPDFGLDDVLREPLRPTPRPVRDDQDSRDRGMSIGSIIVIGLVLSSLFGKKRNGRGGCGCGPLGWIFGVFGLSKFFGWRR